MYEAHIMSTKISGTNSSTL